MSKTYPISVSDRRHLNAIRGRIPLHRIKAVQKGDFRPPKKGEWYLSGAVVEAYYAPNDLTTPHLIANIVEVAETQQVVRALT